MKLAAPAANVGIGLRQPHYRDWCERRPTLGFVEVHSENFFADGGAALAVLADVRTSHDVSLHGVGLSLGAAAGVDPWHLERLARLVERTEPVRVSDHACFARVELSGQPFHANDLLPVAFTRAALDIMAANVQRVQERLRRPLLVENLSAYVDWADQDMDEPEFLNTLAKRAGCGLLVDVNNVVVNALNRTRHHAPSTADGDPIPAVCRWLDAIAPVHVGEMHLAGYCDLGDIVIDDHGSRVHAPVWAAFRHAVKRFGPVPTLVEWDTDVPPLDVLLAEAGTAQGILAQGGAA